MKWLAVLVIIIAAVFCLYSAYFAIAGDNSLFWLIVIVLNIPVLIFVILYLTGRK